MTRMTYLFYGEDGDTRGECLITDPDKILIAELAAKDAEDINGDRFILVDESIYNRITAA